MKRSVAQKLRELRTENGLTQQAMANILKIDRSNYSKYELGKLEPNNDMLVAIAKHFKVTTDYLLGLDN